MRSLILTAALALGFVLLPTAPPISAGPEMVVFPSGAQRSVLYAEVDRPDLKQVRHLFAAPETARSAKPGAPLPAGAVLTMEIYAARADDRGEPLARGGAPRIRTTCAPGSGNTRGSPPTAAPAPPTPGRASRATSPRRTRTTCSRPTS
jgi:hypothetical protein